MKIIFYYYFLGLGGVETALFNRIRALRSVGVESEFWFSEFYGKGAEYAASREFIRRVQMRDPAIYSELQNCDAIAVIDNPGFVNLLKLHGCPIPVIYENHASYPPALDKYYSVVESEIISAIVVPSKYNRTLILEKHEPKAPMTVIPNCVDSSIFSCDAPAIKWPDITANSSPVIVWVGRLEDEKNPQELMSIARQLEIHHGEVQFLVVGDTPDFENYFRALEESTVGGIPSSLSFCRHVKFEDMPGVYNLAAKSGGLLLSTSRYESAPMIFIEAMACGCPIVSSAVGGVSELIKHGENGFLYQSGDFVEACRLINELTDTAQSSRRNSMVKNGLNFVQSKHSIQANASSWKSFFHCWPEFTIPIN